MALTKIASFKSSTRIKPSIVNKLSQFQSFVYSHNFDVIAITETWLSNSIFDNEILPTNYKIYCNDRGSRGGGVLLAVRDNIISIIILPHKHRDA